MNFWVLLILTVIFWGTAPVLDKMALENANQFQGVVIRSFVVFFVLLLSLLFTGKFKEAFSVDSKTFLLFSVSGILAGLVAMLTYYAILKVTPASKVVPLASIYPMVAVILSILFLKEDITLAKIGGTLFIIAGVWLLRI